MSIKYNFIFILFVVLTLPCGTQAATLGAVANHTAPKIGQPIRIDIPLDTQGDDVNAIQAEIVFPADQFMLRSLNDGASPVSFWITPPMEIASGVVAFSGIMPGGFQGAASSVVSLWLLPTTSGTGTIALQNVELLRNDGEGTPITVVTTRTVIEVSATTASSTPPRPASFIAPESFMPVIAQDPSVYGGHYFLAFSTTDKGSGIDYYQVLEIPPDGSGMSGVYAWQTMTSPYFLQDQTLESKIYVRAVDHAGNFIVVEVPAEHPAESHNHYVRATIFAIVFCLLLAAILFMIRSRRRRKRV